MSSTLIPQGVLIASFWLLMASLCVAWGGARLFLPWRKHRHRKFRSESRMQRIHAYRVSKRRHKKAFQYRLIGFSVLIAGALGLYTGFKILMEFAL